MAYQDNVLAMMVSNLYTTVGATAPSPTGSGSSVGVTNPGTPPALFCEPEHVPEKTFIVEALPGDNGFISSANDYHTTYGLNPTSIRSMEHLLSLLATSAEHLDRMRVVGHVGVGATTGDANLSLAFFDGGQRVITRQMLLGFNHSDERGLRAIIDKTTFDSARNPYLPDFMSEILQALSVDDPAVLTPLGLTATSSLTGDLRLFVASCNDLLFIQMAAANQAFGRILRNGTDLSSTQRGYLTTGLTAIGNAVRSRLTFTATDLNNFRTAVLRLNFWILNSDFPMYSNVSNFLLRAVRAHATRAASLTPFGIGTTAPASGSNLEKFIFACTDRWFATMAFSVGTPFAGLTRDGNAITGTLRTSLLAALDARVTHFATLLAPPTGTNTAGEVSALQTALLGVSEADVTATGLTTAGTFNYAAGSSMEFTDNGLNTLNLLNEANQGITRSYRTHLAAAKLHFNANSWVDIRGCRVGQDPDYMLAIRTFFGQGTGSEPRVTGPDWFQSFPYAGADMLTTEANIDTLWNSGRASRSHTSAEIQAAFTKAGPGAGTDVHMNFWRAVAALEDFEFTATVWKGSLPDLPVDAPRLVNFNSLNFTDTITSLGTIFNLTISAPMTTALTRIQAAHSHIFGLQSEIASIAAMGTSPAVAVLSASFTRLQAVNAGFGITVVPAVAPGTLTTTVLQTYTGQLLMFARIVPIYGGPAALFNAWMAINVLTTQATPAAADITAQFTALQGVQTTIGATGIVPASEPTGLTAATLLTYAEALIAFLQNAAPLHTFKTDLGTKVNHNYPASELAQFRYYLSIGLALLIDKPDHYHFYVWNALMNEAIRSFMPLHWQGNIPTPNQISTSIMSMDRARQISMLSEAHGTSPIGINPYPEFHNHIVTVP